MKDNTQDAKSLLQKALANTPDDNALSEVRYHIRAALGQLESVEKKRDKRAEVARKIVEKKNARVVGQYDPFLAIRAIDEEIAKEKFRIDEIRKRRLPTEKENDDDEFQTVFG